LSLRIFLPPDFSPEKTDVVIGRGRKSHTGFGNERLHRVVASKLDEYSAATTKTEKSKILSVVVYLIRNEKPAGLFVKQDPVAGLWFDVGDLMAREKVSQAFRDALHQNYKSSNESKKRRRLEKSASLNSLAHTKKSKLRRYEEGSLNADWGRSSKKALQPKKSASTGGLLHMSRKSKFYESKGVRLNAEWKNDDFLRPSIMLNMDSGGKMPESNIVSKVSSSLPSSSFLAKWLEEEENAVSVIEPIPLPAIPDKENEEDMSEHLPSITDFEEFIKKMDIDDDSSMISPQ